MRHLTTILDKVANVLQARGLTKLAAEVDVVANTIDLSDLFEEGTGSKPGTSDTASTLDFGRRKEIIRLLVLFGRYVDKFLSPMKNLPEEERATSLLVPHSTMQTVKYVAEDFAQILRLLGVQDRSSSIATSAPKQVSDVGGVLKEYQELLGNLQGYIHGMANIDFLSYQEGKDEGKVPVKEIKSALLAILDFVKANQPLLLRLSSKSAQNYDVEKWYSEALAVIKSI